MSVVVDVIVAMFNWLVSTKLFNIATITSTTTLIFILPYCFDLISYKESQ